MNNKGFTLVELLGVLLILASVSLVAVGGISDSLERRHKKECEEQKELAIGAAKIYFSLATTPNNPVSIQTLVNDGYITDNNKVDRLAGTDTINSSLTYSGTNCG